MTAQNGSFQQIIRRKGLGFLDSVGNYPILTPTAGILTRLAFQSPVKGREVAINALLNEATFTLESLEFMIPPVQAADPPGSGLPNQNKELQQPHFEKFSFCNYEEVG